jgi:succinyl-diaminopimelate desuccinylase
VVDRGVKAARAAARRGLRPGLAALAEWLAIPSVSGSRAHEPDVWRAARWATARLEELTAEVRLERTAHGPVVLARLRSGVRRADAPLLVVYGHLDVKPPGQGWTGDPFRPRVRGQRLIARGASDDKGQLMAHLVALRAWRAISGSGAGLGAGLGGDVVVVVDGAEEVGSPGLEEALARHRHGLLAGRPIAVLVSDTRSAGPGVPSLTVSQRGLLSLRVGIDSGGPAVHAGRLGGAVLDPAVALAGRLPRAARAVHALRTRCPAETDGRPDADIARAAGGRALHPDHLVDRTTVRGVLSVTGWRCVGGPGAVPSRAEAILDVRVPAGVSLADAEGVVRRALAGTGPLRTDLHRLASTDGLCAPLPAPMLTAVRRACVDGYGVPPRVDASGGSIPALSILRCIFPAPPILLGVGPVDDGAHGPDEYLHLGDWARGVQTSVSLMGSLLSEPDVRWPGRAIASPAGNRLTRLEYQPCHGPSGASRRSVPRDAPTSRT